VFYIKKLQSQELGSGTGARGRYFYISKKLISFFPPLSMYIINDTVLLSIINNEINPTHASLSAFVYHNDQFSRPPRIDGKKPRNEYRLYLNDEIDPTGSFFNVDDIIALKEVDKKSYTYVLYRFTKYSEYYSSLEEILGGTNHKLVDNLNFIDNIEFVEDEITTSITQEAKDKISKTIEENESSFDNDEIANGAHLFNSETFRKFILNSYDEKCAVTGKVIKWKLFNNLEAAHIKPKSHCGPFLPSNGICMSKNIHWAFDKGFFTIQDDLTIKVHPELIDTELNEFDGKKIFEPVGTFFKPNPKYLKYHRENVFGLFKISGQIRSL